MSDGAWGEETHPIRLLWARAQSGGVQPVATFIRNLDGDAVDLAWCDILHRAWETRLDFKARGLKPGARVVLSLPTSEHFLGALLGALWAGLVPSALHVPAAADPISMDEWQSLIRNFDPALIVGDRVPPDLPVPVASAESLGNGMQLGPPRADFADLRSLVYIQFTSGSTGMPKGLALEWPAIRTNLAAIAEGAPVRAEDRVVSWLPMYHDMGLFGGLLTVLQVGARGIYMDPSLFIRSPLFWLRSLERHRATIVTTPPSALLTCMELIERRGSGGLNLSSLRQIICGSEPVSRSVVDAFDRVLVPLGVHPAALKPVYGLAEATLAVSFPPWDRRPWVDRVSKGAFEQEGRAIPASADEDEVQDWVSAGAPLKGIELKITDEEGRSLGERRVGRIWLSSPSLMSGVLEKGVLATRMGDWLDTGDLGYLAEGEIFVTGRRKDLIIRHGRNYSPERIEQLARLIEGVRRAAAFGVPDRVKLTERMVLAIEARVRDLADAGSRDRLRLQLRGKLHGAGYPVDEILLVGRPGLPRTSSGKVRRQRCRELYLAGELVADQAGAAPHER
jgi:acyl-CoA synthetase (AMP-forming)/AMP-acid ligase II